MAVVQRLIAEKSKPPESLVFSIVTSMRYELLIYWNNIIVDGTPLGFDITMG